MHSTVVLPTVFAIRDASGAYLLLNMRIRLTNAIAATAICTLVLTACAAGAEPVIGEPWTFGGSVPEEISVPIPPDGTVVNSLVTAKRTTVMVSYPGTRLLDLVAFYDGELAEALTTRSEHTTTVEDSGTAWTVRWSAETTEVRVGQCIDPVARTLTLVCVVIDQRSA